MTWLDDAWKPQIVGVKAAPLRVALLCPSCGAPLPEHAENDYRFSVCKYCKVVSADVSVDDAAMRPALPSMTGLSGFSLDLASIGFGPFYVASHASHIFSLEVLAPFRPVAIWLDPSIAKYFLLQDFKVGVNSQFIHSNPIPGTVAAMGDGYIPRTIKGMDTCMPGMRMSFQLSSVANTVQNAFGLLRGRTLDTEQPLRAPAHPIDYAQAGFPWTAGRNSRSY